MRDDECSEWVNSYVLLTKKAPDGMPKIWFLLKKSGEQIFQPGGFGYA